jgi:hypothetical protein
MTATKLSINPLTYILTLLVSGSFVNGDEACHSPVDAGEDFFLRRLNFKSQGTRGCATETEPCTCTRIRHRYEDSCLFALAQIWLGS